MRRSVVVAGLFLLASVTLHPRPAVSEIDSGRAGLGLALRRLSTIGTFMMVTAHPDDENNAVLAMMSRGLGVRTVLATATRGEGGQNEIGPELFEALAALRTEELLAAHRLDGAEQFFTRAVDFGYSFSLEETFERWGREEILGDFVRLIRMTRPDVIVGLRPDGTGGGQHHQASARLAREAFRAAGDPAKFPDQIREGLRPWQAAKFYFSGPFGFRGEAPVDPAKKFVVLNLETYDPLIGRTYLEIGSQARAMHKCQGFGQLLALPARSAAARYELVDTTLESQRDKSETSLFDGLDISLHRLVADAGPQAGPEIAGAIERIAGHVKGGQAAFDSGRADAIIEPLTAGLEAVRELRRRLAALPDGARYELDFRLAQKEQQFTDALILAAPLRIEILADDGVVVPGQPVKLSAIVANRGTADVRLRSVQFSGFQDAACVLPAESVAVTVWTCASAARLPADARLTDVHWKRRADADRYDLDPDLPFGVPFASTPFRASIALRVGRADLTLDRPVEYRYEGDIFSGEKRMELNVVPAFGVRIDPEIAIVGRDPSSRARELRVTVANHGKTTAASQVSVRVPENWKASPERAEVSFTREDEAQTVRVRLEPPSAARTGEYSVDATVGEVGGSAVAGLGVQAVEYPHIQRRHLVIPATVPVKALDVAIAPNLTVGYVMGVGDEVPQAIEQLGATVEMLDADALAWGDLSRFDAIMTGVRAYERRTDLRAYNHRLIEYASKGGVVLVQYNKFEFNQAQYGPLPAKVSSDRVTDERAPVKILDPTHPVFRTPNPIDSRAWEGWVQERGLYFLGDRDARYVDLVELSDPFEYNKGPKRGALVEASVGRGRWMYIGLGLWRQLAAGTPGAYALLANLLSLGRA